MESHALSRKINDERKIKRVWLFHNNVLSMTTMWQITMRLFCSIKYIPTEAIYVIRTDCVVSGLTLGPIRDYLEINKPDFTPNP